MADYIEREEAMFRLSKWLEKASDTNKRGLYNFGEIAAYQTSIVEINSIPAADVAPVRHGRWIVIAELTDCVYAKCDQCKITQVFYHNKPLTNYCPACGADLHGKEK